MKAAIELENVDKKLGRRTILKDVSFSVNAGDIFGYLGPNGAGKTTTIRIILGLLAANAGRASILGKNVNVDATRHHVGFVLEADGLYDNMTAYDNMMYYARIYGVAQPEPMVAKMLKLGGLADRAKDKVSAYSKGMRQRLALARALVHNPDILILDEPTAGIDPSGQIEVRQTILDAAHKEGKTVFLSSHNLDEVQRICNRIALIQNGRIKLYGELEEMQRRQGKGEVLIETAEPVAEKIIKELESLPGLSLSDVQPRALTLALGKNGDVPGLVSFLVGRGAKIEQVKRREASLEEIYTAILKEAGEE